MLSSILKIILISLLFFLLKIESYEINQISFDNHNSNVKIITHNPSSNYFQSVGKWLEGKIKLLDISYDQAQEIGKKIWYNECKNRIDQLTFWNENEPFPSIGIGHFIWPPKIYKGIFSEGRFHKVIEFMDKNNVEFPKWLLNEKFCPWSTREEFYLEFNSVKMNELRSFLIESVPYQAMYMVERLNEALSEIYFSLLSEKRKEVINQFFRVGRTLKGPYILIDYLNFKHEGTNSKEFYCNQGWGLKQVLEAMANVDIVPGASPEKIFAKTAKLLLQMRILNSPNSKQMEQWLPIWNERLRTYYR